MSKLPYILEKYIYAPPGVTGFEARASFWVRHGFAFGLALALFAHVGFWGYQAYRYFIAPFDVDVVEEAFEVEWLRLNDPRFKPLGNPESGFRAPETVVPLDELKKREREAAKKRAERNAARREAEREKAKREAEEKKSAAKEKEKRDGDAAGNAEKSADGKDQSERKSSGPLGFGKINATPIKAIVNKLYDLNEEGKLDLQSKAFVITLQFVVEQDGSLSGIRIVKSSGINEIDEAALNIARAVSASRALGPLHALSSTTLTLDCGASLTALRITGFASDAEEAAKLESVLNLGLQVAKFVNKPEVTVMTQNAKVKADGKRLSANVTMTRSQVNELLRKNFKKA